GLGSADRGIGSERLKRRSALDDARGCLTAQRRGGVSHRESVRRAAEARQAGARHSRPWRRHLSRWPRHGGDELVSVRRSGGRNRRPRNAAVASVVPGTLPDAAGAEQERMIFVLAEGRGGVSARSAASLVVAHAVGPG